MPAWPPKTELDFRAASFESKSPVADSISRFSSVHDTREISAHNNNNLAMMSISHFVLSFSTVQSLSVCVVVKQPESTAHLVKHSPSPLNCTQAINPDTESRIHNEPTQLRQFWHNCDSPYQRHTICNFLHVPAFDQLSEMPGCAILTVLNN